MSHHPSNRRRWSFEFRVGPEKNEFNLRLLKVSHYVWQRECSGQSRTSDRGLKAVEKLHASVAKENCKVLEGGRRRRGVLAASPLDVRKVSDLPRDSKNRLGLRPFEVA